MKTLQSGELEPEQEHAVPRLLLVDDERDILSVLGEILEEYGFAVVSAWDGEDAVEIAALYQPDVLLTDYRLPGMDGVTASLKIRADRPATRVILMSGYISPATRERAVRARVECILEKPLSIPDLLQYLADGRTHRRSATDPTRPGPHTPPGKG